MDDFVQGMTSHKQTDRNADEEVDIYSNSCDTIAHTYSARTINSAGSSTTLYAYLLYVMGWSNTVMGLLLTTTTRTICRHKCRCG